MRRWSSTKPRYFLIYFFWGRTARGKKVLKDANKDSAAGTIAQQKLTAKD